MPIAISCLRLRSGRAQSNLELVVEVRQRPLRSGARSCGLAVPTAIRSSQLRSGSAHSDLGLAVEVRTDGRKDEETEEVSLIKSRGCLKALTRQVGNSNNMFAEFGSTQQFHKNSLSLQLCFQKTTCLSNWALWATSLVWLSQRPAVVFAQATENGPPIQAGTWNIL